MRFLFLLLISAVLFLTSGCSVVGKHIYYEPQILENSTYSGQYLECRCNEAALSMHWSLVGQKVYTIGPPIIPIIPTFGMLDILPGERGFQILLFTKGTTTKVDLTRDSLSLILSPTNVRVKAENILSSDCSQSSKDGHWTCMYNYQFLTRLANVDSFTVKINQPLNNCTIPPISYKEKDYSYFYPFIIPLDAAYR
jgi:hypothetical protein